MPRGVPNLSTVVTRGDRLKSLEALRDKLARTIESPLTEPQSVAGLAKQLAAVLAEIEDLAGPTEVSKRDELAGQRESVAPLFEHRPPAVGSAAGEAIELAESAGLILDPWQRHDLGVMLGENQRGGWACSIFAELVPRQNGKGGVTEARELAGLFLFGERVLTHTAHEVKTSNAAMRRMLDLIEDTPDLDRLVKKVLQGNVEKSITLKSGQRLQYIARSKGSGRGLTGNVIVLDEAMILALAAIDALIPSMSAVSDQQLIIQGTPPLPDEEASDALRKIMRLGRAGALPRMGYVEYAAAANEFFDLSPAEQRAFIADEANWERANPSLDIVRSNGTGLNREYVRDTEMPIMTVESFARERLGIVYLSDLGEGSDVLPNWPQCAVTTGDTMADPVSLAIDVSPGSRTGAIGAAGEWGDRVLLELVDHRAGTSWIVPRLLELRARWSCRKHVLLDPAGPAGALIPELEQAKIPFRAVSGREHAQAVEGLAADVKDGAVAHVSQPELDAAVMAARTRKLADLRLWARASAAEDICPLVAVGLARWGHLQPTDETDDAEDFLVVI